MAAGLVAGGSSNATSALPLVTDVTSAQELASPEHAAGVPGGLPVDAIFGIGAVILLGLVGLAAWHGRRTRLRLRAQHQDQSFLANSIRSDGKVGADDAAGDTGRSGEEGNDTRPGEGKPLADAGTELTSIPSPGVVRSAQRLDIQPGSSAARATGLGPQQSVKSGASAARRSLQRMIGGRGSAAAPLVSHMRMGSAREQQLASTAQSADQGQGVPTTVPTSRV